MIGIRDTKQTMKPSESDVYVKKLEVEPPMKLSYEDPSPDSPDKKLHTIDYRGQLNVPFLPIYIGRANSDTARNASRSSH
jgi:hypothetical protein